MKHPTELLIFFCFLLASNLCNAVGSFAGRAEVASFITEMHDKHGFDSDKLTLTFARIKPIPAVIKAVLPPSDPGIRSWETYRSRFIEPKRLKLGEAFWRKHNAALRAAREQSGVPEDIIVAIIGIETIYGRNTGKFGALAALATLAFDYPQAESPQAQARATLFRHELEELLLLARETHIDPLALSGSYAGALGLPQFLPSSVRKFALDADNDGRIDLARSPADAIASVANFLKQHGWVPDAPVTAPVTVTGDDFNKLLEEGISPRLTPSEMLAYGVNCGEAPELPAALIDLVTPHQPTEYRLGYRNFYVLTRYNRSSFYAMAVHDLAKELRTRH